MSVRSELIRLLDGVALLGQRNYADERPEGEPLPHCVVIDQISLNPQLVGDGRSIYWRHTTQVDLWEDATISNQETRDAIIAALDGQRIDGSLSVRVESADRVYEPDRRLAHTVFNVACSRRTS